MSHTFILPGTNGLMFDTLDDMDILSKSMRKVSTIKAIWNDLREKRGETKERQICEEWGSDTPEAWEAFRDYIKPKTRSDYRMLYPAGRDPEAIEIFSGLSEIDETVPLGPGNICFALHIGVFTARRIVDQVHEIMIALNADRPRTELPLVYYASILDDFVRLS